MRKIILTKIALKILNDNKKMLNKEIEGILNQQIGIELFASNSYLSLASWAMHLNLDGVAAYFYDAAEDERTHFLEMYKYINENGGVAKLGTIAQPKHDFENLLTVFEFVYELEHNNTLAINEIADLCMRQKDYATFKFMEAFVLEQQEAEKSVSELIHMIKTLGFDQRNLFFINKHFRKLSQNKAAANPGIESN